MWSKQFGFPYMPFPAFSSPAVWCHVFQFRVFQSCSFDCAVFSGLAFSVPPRGGRPTGVHVAQGEMKNMPFDIGCVSRSLQRILFILCGRPQVTGLKTPQSVEVLSLDWLIYLHCGKLQWCL